MRSVNPSYRQERRGLALMLAASSLAALTGCGSTLYSLRANAASGKLEEARELGAEQSAAYEYFYAKEHLQKAQTEAAEADYSDAVDLAEASEEYADKALRIAREARSGAPK